MSEPENKPPTEVLRTKRLEIVDEGKVCAVLGTNEEGVTSLSLFDRSTKLRTALDASDVPKQMNGLGIFDADGGLQVTIDASAVNVNEGRLHFYGPIGEDQAIVAMHREGSGLVFNDTKGDRRAGLTVNDETSSFYVRDANGMSRGGSASLTPSPRL